MKVFWAGWPVELLDRSQLHQVDPHEAGEGKKAGDADVSGVRHAQQQVGDQCHRDLDAYGILAGAEELADLQRLLDPAEEQLDLPAGLIKIGDRLGRT